MKLTKMQVSALADKIINEIKQPIIDSNKAIKESKAYKEFDKRKDCQTIIKLLSRKGVNSEAHYVRNLINDMRDNHFADKVKTIPYISRSSIENEIIVSTIEHDDLDSLIQSIKDKYSK